MDRLEQITAELNAMKERADTALQTVEDGKATADQVAEVKALLDGTDDQPGLTAQIADLTKDREEALQAKAVEDMTGRLTTIQGAIEDLRKPDGRFVLPDPSGENSNDDDNPYAKGEFSVFADVRRANKGDQKALERLTYGFENLNPEGKAMTEGTDAQGGYLVQPQIERQIVEAVELNNVLRGLCSSINVTTNAIQLDQIGLTTTAGWVAELAQKPESTGLTLTTVTANVFTAAGLATISNQLLADSNPAVDGLVTTDLAKRLVALEETAFLNGTGTGQPLGILNTPGIGATPLTSTDEADLVDAILDAIADVETDHGAPTAILMHPRTWTRILKAKSTSGAWLLGGPQDVNAPVGSARTELRGPTKSLWGYRVVTTNRMPTNLGGATNESRVIVGDFSEALILDRQGLTVDESPHVYFTTNQTVFRAEERVGFTAARSPAAFNVVGGAGLADG
jgi:HK97 family phage major capsid protein